MSFFKDLDKNETGNDSGLLSQDAIEALFASMNSAPAEEPPAQPAPAEPAPAVSAPADDGGVMSQDAIAALFASMNSAPAVEETPAQPAPAEPAPAVSAPADDGGVMSQDAIAALFASMNSAPAVEETPVQAAPAEPAPAVSAPADDGGVMSQDAIAALFASMNSAPAAVEELSAVDSSPSVDDGLFEYEDEPVASDADYEAGMYDESVDSIETAAEVSERDSFVTSPADDEYTAAPLNSANDYRVFTAENDADVQGEDTADELFGDSLVDSETTEADTDFEINASVSEAPQMHNGYADNSDQCAIITRGTTINGSIISDCSLNVIGTVNGDIECIGKLTITGRVTGNSIARDVFVNTRRLEGNIDSEGTVKISLGTIVVGNIVAKSAVIAGAIKGDVDVKGPVILDSTAIIMGNVKAKSVQVNNGAVLQGYCSLAYSELDLNNIFE